MPDLRLLIFRARLWLSQQLLAAGCWLEPDHTWTATHTDDGHTTWRAEPA